MFKWIGGSVAGVAILVLFGSNALGYVQTLFGWAKEKADDAVSIELKVANAERMVAELNGEIRNFTKAVTEQQIDKERLEATIATQDAGLAKQKKDILALKADLDRGERQYVFNGRSYSSEQVQNDLDLKFKRFKRETDSLKRDRELLQKREDILAANSSRFEEMVAAKKDLESQIASLKDRMKDLKADEAVGALAIDDSKMARARKLIDELNRKLDVEERLRENEGRVASEIKVPEKKEIKNVSKEIEDFFGDEAKPKQEL